MYNNKSETSEYYIQRYIIIQIITLKSLYFKSLHKQLIQIVKVYFIKTEQNIIPVFKGVFTDINNSSCSWTIKQT